ncbi:MAG: signal peptidase II [Acidobacteriota bacterium]
MTRTYPAKPLFLFLSLIVLVLDQWTKQLVELHMPIGTSRPVIDGLLNLTHVHNTGVAFGLFATHGDGLRTVLLIALGLLALTLVAFYFRQVPAHDRVMLVALSLVLGGAVGNLLDRILQGGVTDFIDFYVGDWHWHTFNIADSAITVGIGFMVWSAFRPVADEPETVTDDEPTELASTP